LRTGIKLTDGVGAFARTGILTSCVSKAAQEQQSAYPMRSPAQRLADINERTFVYLGDIDCRWGASRHERHACAFTPDDAVHGRGRRFRRVRRPGGGRMTDARTAGAAKEMDERPSVLSEKRLSSRQEPDAPAGERPRGAMLMRSTGLGKAELVAEIVSIKRQGDYLIMELQTTKPVRWKIRGGLSHKDLRMLLRAMMKLSVLSFLCNLRAWFKEPVHPGNF
jgi:hypothetical protein